jgi:hypothetical protein
MSPVLSRNRLRGILSSVLLEFFKLQAQFSKPVLEKIPQGVKAALKPHLKNRKWGANAKRLLKTATFRHAVAK